MPCREASTVRISAVQRRRIAPAANLIYIWLFARKAERMIYGCDETSSDLAFAMFFSLICALPASAQTTAGVSGTITDESGAAIPGVTLTITNAETKPSARDGVSDESGYYQLLLLQPGAYILTAKKTGFRQATRERIAAGSEPAGRRRVSLFRWARSLKRWKSSGRRRYWNRVLLRWAR